MKLDFLLCGSATPSFFSQFAFFRHCLDALGGHYREARVVAAVGDHSEERIPEDWAPYLERVEVKWAHEVGAENISHTKQHYARFELIRDDADLCFICDADVAPLAPFDELLVELVERPALAGVMAHYPFPMPDNGPRNPERDWQVIARSVLRRSIELDQRFTLQPERRTPFYINYGVFAGTPSLMKRFGRRDAELFHPVAEHVGTWWAAQVSLALTCLDLDLPVRVLPPRYNFPNYAAFDEAYPAELANIKLIHYLGLKHFDRQKIFCDEAAFDAFLAADLNGSDAVFQARVAGLTGSVFPYRPIGGAA